MNIYERLCEAAGQKAVLRDEAMSRHTTFRTGGPADYLVQPGIDTIGSVLTACREEKVPYTVIGNGSNLLVGDRGIRGVVVEIGKSMGEIAVDGETVYAQAGALMTSVAGKAAAESLTGLEFASGIPGSIGGAVTMNAGAYGGEIKDVLTKVTLLYPDGSLRECPAEQLDLSYRHSLIQEQELLVLEAWMQLKAGKAEDIYGRMNELKEKRVSKQPLEFPSAGSTFKRPEGYFAGKLIEDAGLRGYSIGGAQVSEKHCGFVINKGGASSADVLNLIHDVQSRVKEQFGVDLETEVRLLGEF